MLGFLFLSVFAVAGISMVEEGEAAPEAPDEVDGAEDTASNSLDLLSNTGNVTGTDGDDTFSIAPGPIPSGEVDYAEFFDGDVQYRFADDEGSLPEAHGGAGDDTFLVKNGHALIETGTGADTVDASQMEGGIIRAGEGDHVSGSDVAKDNMLGIVMDGSGVVKGGDAGEIIVARGDGAQIDGGAGDDQILSDGGGATINAGDGDDVVDANVSELEYSGHWDNSGEADGFIDRIDLGAGDDRVEDVSNGDILTLGEGSDVAHAIYDHELDHLGPLVVTDFNPLEDRVELRLDLPLTQELQDAIPDWLDDYVDDPSAANQALEARLEIVDTDGDSHVFFDNKLVASFENVTGLTPVPTVTYDRYDAFEAIGLRFLPA